MIPYRVIALAHQLHQLWEGQDMLDPQHVVEDIVVAQHVAEDMVAQDAAEVVVAQDAAEVVVAQHVAGDVVAEDVELLMVHQHPTLTIPFQQ